MQDLRHFAGRFVLVAAICAAAASASAQDGSFIDTEFDLADYAVSSFPGARDTTLIRHIATGGAPGAALEVQTERPAGAHRSTHYFINQSFEHDTALSGAIAAIDMHIDVYTAFEPAIRGAHRDAPLRQLRRCDHQRAGTCDGLAAVDRPGRAAVAATPCEPARRHLVSAWRRC